MADRFHELKAKMMKAQSASEVADYLREAGEDETRAESIWNEVRNHWENKELSVDELNAVCGGGDRDWLKHGCAATVEAGSRCDSNDACWYFSVEYDHMPVKGTCPVCNTPTMFYAGKRSGGSPSTDKTCHQCAKCGFQMWF